MRKNNPGGKEADFQPDAMWRMATHLFVKPKELAQSRQDLRDAKVRKGRMKYKLFSGQPQNLHRMLLWC